MDGQHHKFSVKLKIFKYRFNPIILKIIYPVSRERKMSNELTTNLSSSKANTSIARWYAVQVASSCEKKVKATLEQRSVTLGVNNRIIEIEIPQTPGIKLKKDGSRQTTEEKVFPGYVLVRMILDEDTMMAVKSTPNVINFVGAEDGRGMEDQEDISNLDLYLGKRLIEYLSVPLRRKL